MSKTADWSAGFDRPGKWFMAQYSGECTTCGSEIEMGDDIRSVRPSEGGGWQGRCCEDEPASEPSPSPYGICDRCRVALPASRVCDECS